MANKALIYIGTSGWSYNHWKNLFYPLKLSPQKYLSFYSQHFNTVELNSSFYHLPQQKTFEKWYSQTPQDFVFSVKTPRFITHIKKLKNCRSELKIFLERIDPLKEKLGAVLLQFPSYFKANQKNVEKLENFLKNLSDYVFSPRRPFKFALEFRDKSWAEDRIYNLLSIYNIAWVISDSSKYPKIAKITADFIYIRMHGPKELFSSKYSRKELNLLADQIAKWRRKVNKIFIYFNNDFYGYAIENARELKSLVGD